MRLIATIGVVIAYLLLWAVSIDDILAATRMNEVWADIVTIAIGTSAVTFVLTRWWWPYVNPAERCPRSLANHREGQI